MPEQVVLQQLAAVMRAEGGLLADGVASDDQIDCARESTYGSLVVQGPRVAKQPSTYALLVEAIREGWLLHYAKGRVITDDTDPDMALLAGDWLYALGLEHLTQLGDLDALRELTEVIALSVQAQNAGDFALAEAVWQAGVVAVGWGSNAQHVQAKNLARRSHSDAILSLNAFAALAHEA